MTVVATLKPQLTFHADKIRGLKTAGIEYVITDWSSQFEAIAGSPLECVSCSASASVVNPLFIGNATLSATLNSVSCAIEANVSAPALSAEISAALASVDCTATVTLINTVGNISATLSPIACATAARYDSNVKRVSAAISECMVQNAIQHSLATHTAISHRAFLLNSARSIINDTQRLVALTTSIQQQLAIESHRISVLSTNTLRISAALLSITNRVDFLLQAINSTLRDNVPAFIDITSIQDVLTLMLQPTLSAIDNMPDSVRTILYRVYEHPQPTYRPHVDVIELGFTDTDDDNLPFYQTIITPNNFVERIAAWVKGVYSSANNSVIVVSELLDTELCAIYEQAIPPPYGTRVHIDRPRPTPAPYPPLSNPLVIPIREVYTMQHVISVVTVIGNHPVALNKISLSYNRDSFCWLFSGELADKADLVLVTPTDNNPVELSITINGHNWVVIVEKMPESKSFGSTRISLSGKSLSGLLGDLYQRQVSYTAGSEMTVQQIAESLLPVGWTLDWRCATPWLVPENTFSYTQQNPLQALSMIAKSIGAIVKPSRTERVLTIQPCYSVLPWDYYAAGIMPDLVVPDSAIDTIGIESTVQSVINAVYVHGDQNGVLALCRLTGTAGDVLAPTQSNPLMTDVVGARALGERVLAGLATQPKTTAFTTYLGGYFPLAETGWLVEVNDERAIVNGVAIEANTDAGGAIKVRQTITVGEQTDNVYTRLLNLLPSPPLLVGRLVSSNSEVSLLTLLDGGVITARGTGTIGANYYVRNGLIESAAPSLALSEIVI